METAIQLKVRKDLDAHQQHTILKLKGSLISKGYTEIIHILDQDEEFHINTFETATEKRNEVQEYITSFINQENLVDTIQLPSVFTNRARRLSSRRAFGLYFITKKSR